VFIKRVVLKVNWGFLSENLWPGFFDLIWILGSGVSLELSLGIHWSLLKSGIRHIMRGGSLIIFNYGSEWNFYFGHGCQEIWRI
jgi:hypothetical protein